MKNGDLHRGGVVRLHDVYIIGVDPESGLEVNVRCGDEMFITAEMREGVEQVQRNGSGEVAASFKPPPTFGRIQIVAPRESHMNVCPACSGDGHVHAADHVYWAADGEVGCLKCVARDDGTPCPVCKGAGNV
jgi:hypothetical protein